MSLLTTFALLSPPVVPPDEDKILEAALLRGTQYLVRTQARNGSWVGDGSYGPYPVSMTSLAGLGILAGGSTPTRGKHWRSVRKAADYLIKQAGPTGLIAVQGVESRTMYGHGFAMLFLSQVYGMETDPRMQARLKSCLTRAIALCVKSQGPLGGWYYTPDSRREEASVAITQVQGLRACRDSGLHVPKKTIDRAIKYIHKLQNPDGGIAYSLSNRGSRPALSAAAVAVLYNCGRYDDPAAEKALKHAHKHISVNGSGRGHNYYAQFYLAQSLYLRNDERWDKYYVKLRKWMLRQQQKDGSWRGDSVGKSYGTGIALVLLQLPKNLVPIFQR